MGSTVWTFVVMKMVACNKRPVGFIATENLHTAHQNERPNYEMKIYTRFINELKVLVPFISSSYPSSASPPPTHKQLIHNGSYLHSWMCFPVYTCTSRRTCIHTLCPNLPKIQIIRKVCFGSIRERQPYAILCSITCYQLSLAFILSRMGLSCSFSLAHSRHICTWLISMRLFQWHSPLLTHNQAYTHSNWWYTHTYTCMALTKIYRWQFWRVPSIKKIGCQKCP